MKRRQAMPIMEQPYTLLLIIAAAISAALSIAVLKYRPTLGTRSFAALTGSVALWALVAFFEVASRDPMTKLFSHGLKYIFIVSVPIAWLTFGLFYSNRLRKLETRYLLLLACVPAATLALIATNPYHHLMFETTRWYQTDTYYLIFRSFGPWFWVHTVYCYILLVIGFVYLAKSLIDSPTPYRKQLTLLMIGGLTPWACNFLFIFNIWPLPYLDLTPFAFTISGLAFMLGIVRYRLLDIIPVARNLVIQNLRDGVIVLDTNHRIVDLNPTAARMLDKPITELIGAAAERSISWWKQIASLPDPPPATEAIAETSPPHHPAVELYTQDRKCIIQASRFPLFIEDKASGHLVLLRDITTAKQSENALRNSETRFRSLTENAPVIIFAVDTSGIVTYTNPACLKILGYRREEVVGRPFFVFLVENQARLHKDAFKRLVEGEESLAEINLYFQHRNGSKRLFNTCAAVNTDPEGCVTGIIGMAKDITEERKLQLQLFQAQKMEAIGTLAGGIAHDFNNLLMGMQANISLMRLDDALQEAHNEKLNRIEDQIQSGASLTRQLLGYARKGKYVVDSIDLGALIKDALNVVQRTNKNITTACKLTEEPTLIDADRGQIELVLLNLFVNAVDAMPGGGELRVDTRIVDTKMLKRLWADLNLERFVELRVTDTGIGMDQRTMDRIFEPFFTTKEMGQGTGLGLASVYGVVKNHDGFIRVDSQVGKGTTFTLLFPLSKKTALQPTSPIEGAALPPRTGKLMLVDDEALVLEYCGEMIESLGYTVLQAAGGEQAVELFEKHHTEIDAVILDMIMPGMDGLQVYRALKAIDANLRVIVSSGYATDARTEEILADGPHACLKKPYTPKDLATLLSAMLDPAVESG